MQPSTKQQQLTDQTYLKLSIDYMQLFSHVLFNPQGKRLDEIEIILYVEYMDEGINDSVRRLQEISMVNTRNRNTEDLIFEPLTNRWDCLCFKGSSNNPKGGLLKLQYQIRNTLEGSFREGRIQNKLQSSFLEGRITQKANQKRQQEKRQKVIVIRSKNESMRKYVALPYKSKPISFPLQKILKQPYVIDELTIDVYIKNHSKPQGETIKSQTQNNNIKSQTQNNNERDGVIGLNIVYLPNIKPHIKIKNISIRTKAFANTLTLLVKEIAKQQSSPILNHKFNQTTKIYSRTILSQVVIPLEVGNWQHFQNSQSFQNPISIPLILNNNLDQIEFSITYEVKTKHIIEKHNQAKQGKQKQANKRNKNTKAVEQDNKEKQKKQPQIQFQQRTRRYEIIIKRMAIQKLSRQKSPNQEWTKQSYKCKHQQKEFQLQFLFNLSLNLQAQITQKQQRQEQKNCPQQENDRCAEEFDQLDIMSKIS